MSKKCEDCGQEETSEYLEEYGELVDCSVIRGNERYSVYYCHACNEKYYSEE